MEAFVLPVESRSSGTARDARRLKRVPAVCYGAKKETFTVSMDHEAFRKVFRKAGESSIIELQMDGKKIPVLVHDVQYHPVSERFEHVDFLAVDMNKPVTAMVTLEFTGVAPAVKDLGGIFNTHKHELEIKCLPKDLVSSLSVDVSGLVDFHTAIHVRDVAVSQGITVLDDPEDTVANVTPPRVEEEAIAAPAAEDAEGAPSTDATEGAGGTEKAPQASGEKGAKEDK